MGIESNSNDFAPTPGAPSSEEVKTNQERHTNFGGTTLGGAPTGSGDFLSFTSRIGLSRMDSTVEPYLEEILKLTKECLPGVSMLRMVRAQSSYAFKFEGSDGVPTFFGIQFVSPRDPVSQNFVPASMRMGVLLEELRDTHQGKQIRIADSRVILAGYEGDMSRAYEMADTIIKTFQVTAVNEVKEATIEHLTGTEFVVDWSLAAARSAEQVLSPHGVRSRMDIGLTVSAKIKNEYGRDFREFDNDFRLFGVIGGYTEIREKEEFIINNQRVMMYRPVFNITVCNSVIPLEGSGAILLAAIAPTIFNTHFWVKQWIDLSEGNPNPGMLEEDPDNRGKPIILKNQEELLDFVRNKFATPIICFQFQDGRDAIPGMYRMSDKNPEVRNHLVQRLAAFFGSPDDNAGGMDLSRVIDIRIDGVYGDPAGQLHDSRNIDYLTIAAKNGWGSIDQAMRRTLLGGGESATDRARLVSQITGSFLPLSLETQAWVNPDFIKWIIQRVEGRRLSIIDPTSQEQARTLTSYADGFGSTANMGTIVHTGIQNRGLNLNSIWQR